MPRLTPLQCAIRAALVPLAAAASLSVLPSTAIAQSVPVLTWTGDGIGTSFSGYDPLARRGNFSGGVPQERGAYHLVFDGSRKTQPLNDLRYLQIHSLSFAAGAAAFELGGRTFTLLGDLTNRSRQLQKVHNDLVLRGDQRWLGGSAGLLVDGGLDMAGANLQLDLGSTLRPSWVSLGSGSIGVLPGASLDLTQLGYEARVVFGDAERGGGTRLRVSGVGAGKSVLLPTHTEFARGGLEVLDGAVLDAGYHFGFAHLANSRDYDTRLRVAGAGSRLRVEGKLQFGGEGDASAELREGGVLEARTAFIDGANAAYFDTRFVVGAGGRWDAGRIDLASQSRRREARLELLAGGTVELLPGFNTGDGRLRVGVAVRSDDADAVAARLLVNGGRLIGRPDVQVGVGGVGRFELSGGGRAELRELLIGSPSNKAGRGEFWLSGAGSVLQAEHLRVARGSASAHDGAQLLFGQLTLDAGQGLALRGAELVAQNAVLGAGSLLDASGSRLSFASLVAQGDGTRLLLTGGAQLSSAALHVAGGLLRAEAGTRLDTRAGNAQVGGDGAARAELVGTQWQAGVLTVSGSRRGELDLQGGSLVAQRLEVGVGAGQSGRFVAQAGDGSAYGLDLQQLHVGTAQGRGRAELGGQNHARIQELVIGAGGRVDVGGGTGGRFSVAQAHIEAGGSLGLGANTAGSIEQLRLDGGSVERQASGAALQIVQGHGQLSGHVGALQALMLDHPDTRLQATGRTAQDRLSAQLTSLDERTELQLDYATAVDLGTLRLRGASRLVSSSEVLLNRLELAGGDAEIDAALVLYGDAQLNHGELVLHGDLRSSGNFRSGSVSVPATGRLALLGGFQPERLETRFTLSAVRLGEASQVALDLASAEQFERLRFDGLLQAAGTLALHFTDAAAWQGGGTLDLLDWGELDGGFSRFLVSGLDATRVDFSRLALDGTVRVSAVPEPAPALLLAGGLAVLSLLRRRDRRQA